MTTITQLDQRPADRGAPRVVVVGAGFGGLAAVRRGAAAAGSWATASPGYPRPALHQPVMVGLAAQHIVERVLLAGWLVGVIRHHGG